MIVNNALAANAAAEELGGAFSPERWSYAGQMTLLGMLMVFAVLAILWAVLAIFKLVFAKSGEKTAKAPEAVVNAVAEAVTAVDEPVDYTDDAELVAVITAAVAAYMQSEGSEAGYTGGFRVVSFRRAGGARSWNSK